MSGGSWDYMYCWDIEKFLNNTHNVHLMAKRVTELGFLDAAKAIEDFAVSLDHARITLEVRHKRIQEIMRTVEWEDSNDGYPGQVKDAVEAWRKVV